jgi:hypothetical protein
VAGDQVMPVYKSHLAQLEEILRTQNIVTLPKRAAVIRLSTEAEAAAQPAPHIDPPRLIGNTGEPAEFVLPLKNAQGGEMDDFDSGAIAWTITAHECRPGHELQFAGMLERGVSTARVVYAFNSANVEGWALYAEAVMKQYLPIDGQIGALQMRMLRAARAYLDPMLNLGLIEPDAAKRVLTEEGDAVRCIREVGDRPLYLQLTGSGDLVLLRLQPPRSLTHARGNRARSEVQGTAVPRLHHQRRVAAARPAGAGRDDALRAVAEVASLMKCSWRSWQPSRVDAG